MARITVQNAEITIIAVNGDDYISFIDLVRHKSDKPKSVSAKLFVQLQHNRVFRHLGTALQAKF